MRPTEKNLMLCAMVFAIALVTSNVVAAKTVPLGFALFGTDVLVPAAVVCYAITFLMTDVVGENWGRDEARTIVRWGFVCQLISSALILLARILPASDASMQDAFIVVLGQNTTFTLASLLGYIVSQTWDVYVFHAIRERISARHQNAHARRWIWNNASTMTSQAIDTIIFIGVAFGLGMGWIFDPGMHATLLAMMVGQYLVKFVLAALDTPFFYLLTRRTSS